MTVKQRIATVTAWVKERKPVRVFLQYNAKGGPLLAAGLSYQALFAVFAAIWVGFSIAGFAIKANPDVEQAFLGLLATNLPGLIDTGEGGAIDADALFATGILTWTGAIAAVGLLFTALGWLASGRDAVRLLFGLPTAPTNFLLLKLKDLGLALAFGLAMVLSAVLSVFSTAALSSVFDWLGIDQQSDAAGQPPRAMRRCWSAALRDRPRNRSTIAATTMAATRVTTQIQPPSQAQPSQVSATQTMAATHPPIAGVSSRPCVPRHGSA